MSAKNKPTYDLFCKGIINHKHKGLRFDENENVVCELNAEFGADVEVDGTLTINSAKDLKTKDGTSFGGGGLPSPWVANENVLGYEDTENQLVVGFLAEGGNLYGYQNKQSGEVSYVSPASSSTSDIIVYLNVNAQVESAVVLPDDFTIKSQVINLGDINKKQSTLYRHTITIVGPNGDLSMNIDTESNAKMDSIIDLITKFKGNKLGCYCVSGSTDTMAIYTNITFGSTSAECTLSGRNFKGAILTADTLATVFGKVMEVKDTITAM